MRPCCVRPAEQLGEICSARPDKGAPLTHLHSDGANQVRLGRRARAELEERTRSSRSSVWEESFGRSADTRVLAGQHSFIYETINFRSRLAGRPKLTRHQAGPVITCWPGRGAHARELTSGRPVKWPPDWPPAASGALSRSGGSMRAPVGPARHLKPL